MKRYLISICSIFSLLYPILISAQEIENEFNRKWSISIAYAPMTTFYYYGAHSDKAHKYSSIGITEVIYPKGLNLTVNHTLKNGFAYSIGLSSKARLTNISHSALGFIAESERSTNNRYFLEVPINANFSFPTNSKIFDPYIKSGLRASYYKRYYVGEYIYYGYSGTVFKNIDNREGKLLLFYEFGAGTYINITKQFSALIESNLTYQLSGFGYSELQLGIKYSFK